VRPDGTITLGWYGDVQVAGLTLSQIKVKIIKHLQSFFTHESLGLEGIHGDGNKIAIPPEESDRVIVDVAAYNSKAYYVQGAVQSPGRFPITGNDYVIDALNYAGQPLPYAADLKHMRLVRKGKEGELAGT
jgi:polysaccharide export outer membrane protein